LTVHDDGGGSVFHDVCLLQWYPVATFAEAQPLVVQPSWRWN
jgi:hypothetical protein